MTKKWKRFYGVFTVLRALAEAPKPRLIGLAVGVAILIAGSFSTIPVAAQSFNATLQGTVTDPSGGVVPRANVEMIEETTNLRQAKVTDSRGRFEFTQLPPGGYRLSVEATGFQTQVRTGIQLQVQQQATLDVALTVGNVASTITVAGEAPRLDTVNATLGRVVESKSLLELPLDTSAAPGVGALQLVFLAPGVTGNLGWTGSNFVSNGTRNASSDVLVDGVTQAVHEQNGGALDIKLRPSVEAVQEFKVETNSFSAEYGFTGGTVVNAITRSGTNQLHGDVFGFAQNSVLNANNFFANQSGSPLSPYHEDEFGGTIGGPVVIPHLYNGHNRTFFFFSYEKTTNDSQFTTLDTLPTVLQREGNFSQTFNQDGTLNIIYDPSSATLNSSGDYVRTPFPGNIIPKSRFSTVASAVTPNYPTPNLPGIAGTGENNFFAAGTDVFNRFQLNFKVDHSFNDRQRLSVRYSRVDQTMQAPHLWGNDPWETDGGWSWNNQTNSAAVDYINTINATTVLDVRWGLARQHGLSLASCSPAALGGCNFDAQAAKAAGFTGSLGTPIPPSFNIANYDSIGPNAGEYIVRGEDVNHLTASLTKIIGRNTIKFGAEARLYRLNYGQPGVNSVFFNFSSQTTAQGPFLVNNNQGNAFASFLLGWGSGGNGFGDSGENDTGALSAWAYQSYGFYYQHDIRLTHNLTVNLGVRYELPIPEKERYNRASWFDPSVPSPISAPGFTDLTGGIEFATPGNRAPFNTDKKDWAPRIGFAYQFLPKFVMRGGYGIYYAVTASQLRSPLGAGFATSTLWNSSLDNGVTQFATLANPFPTGVNNPPGSTQGLSTLVGLNTPQEPIRYWDTTPYYQQWNYSIERELPSNSVFEVAYSGSRGVHLQNSQLGNIDYLSPQYYSLGNQLYSLVNNPFYGIITNPSSPLSQPQVQRIQLLLPYPQFLSVNGAPGPPNADSHYAALQVKFTKRYSNGLTVSGSYVFSKQIDDNSTNPNLGSFLGYDAPVQAYTNLALEKSVSTANIPDRVIVDFSYELPLGRGKAFLSHMNRGMDLALGGWQINGILTAQSGYPLIPTTQNSVLPDSTQRPNLLCNPTLSGPIEDRLNMYLNASCFSQPAPFTLGTAPRTLPQTYGPGLRNADVSLFKNVYLGEGNRRYFQIRGEAFNVTNTVQFGTPNTTYGSPGFGVISSQNNSPRYLQLGLKFYY